MKNRLSDDDLKIVKQTVENTLEEMKKQKMINMQGSVIELLPSFRAILGSYINPLTPFEVSIALSVKAYCPELDEIDMAAICGMLAMMIQETTGYNFRDSEFGKNIDRVKMPDDLILNLMKDKIMDKKNT